MSGVHTHSTSAMKGNPTTAAKLRMALRIPVFGGPMFIASTPALVIAQCQAGIVGALPALNPRSTTALDEALHEIKESLADFDRSSSQRKAAPYAVNLVAHRTNDRLETDLAVLLSYKPPIVIVSLAAPAEIVDAVHAYGGLIFNDIISDRQARKCADAGVDGLIAVCAGAGGHTGSVSPFAMVQELRLWWHGPLALSGCIATGRSILAAQVMGADFAYIGSPFLASAEANTPVAFKEMIVASNAADIMVTNCFTGVNATFLRPSVEANGLDPANLIRDPAIAGVNIKGGGANVKAWRDIWSAGQGIGCIKSHGPAAQYIDQLAKEYADAQLRLAQPN